MSDIGSLKKELRKHHRSLRDGMPSELRRAADRIIFNRTAELKEYREAEVLLTYVSCGSEPDTLRLILHALALGKIVACPVCDKAAHVMTFRRIEALDRLVTGAYGIYEPPADAPQVQLSGKNNSLCIVPGLSFDSSGGRLGYGGGYYDRFLSGFRGVSVGLCRTVNLSAQPIPQNEYDLPVDLVITDG